MQYYLFKDDINFKDTDGTGLTLNSTNKLTFRDTTGIVNSSTDGQLDIDADAEVEITAPIVDIDASIKSRYICYLTQ